MPTVKEYPGSRITTKTPVVTTKKCEERLICWQHVRIDPTPELGVLMVSSISMNNLGGNCGSLIHSDEVKRWI